MKIFANMRRSVEEDLTYTIYVVGNLVIRAGGFCEALKRALYGSA